MSRTAVEADVVGVVGQRRDVGTWDLQLALDEVAQKFRPSTVSQDRGAEVPS